MFQSDHAFDVFSSPVTNPFYFVDPRSLTEIKPLFIWQKTPSSNAIFAGSNNFYIGANGGVALTERISLTLNKLGWVFIDPNNPVPPDFANNNGFGEVHLGPKFTIVRNDTSNTLVALGLIFEIPTGSSGVQQDTGSLSLDPYISFAQNFLRSSYGSFNFMNTTGYSFGMDSQRTDFLYSSFHLDFDVGNLKKIYPLIEFNYIYYTSNGGARPLNFEGGNMFNYGSTMVSSTSLLTMAAGFRYNFTPNIQTGLAGEFNLIGGSRNLDAFRLTFDVIFRY
jgi:hypothetical protein